MQDFTSLRSWCPSHSSGVQKLAPVQTSGHSLLERRLYRRFYLLLVLPHGGFFPRGRGVWENVPTIHSPPVLFFFFEGGD